ncbi:MAG: hypothetical protein ACH0QC_15425, partial [Anaerosolibacter sp.]
MSFNEQLPEWNAAGTEPPQQKKDEGWLPTEKPPASFFNWLFNRIFKCIEEIRTLFNGLAGEGRTNETVKENADEIASHKAENVTHLASATRDISITG